MRRPHLRGHSNILKRLLIHSGAFNLGILLRSWLGVGTPRGLQGRLRAILAVLDHLVPVLRAHCDRFFGTKHDSHGLTTTIHPPTVPAAKNGFHHGLLPLEPPVPPTQGALEERVGYAVLHCSFYSPPRARRRDARLSVLLREYGSNSHWGNNALQLQEWMTVRVKVVLTWVLRRCCW